jgi:hypothetical protein
MRESQRSDERSPLLIEGRRPMKASTLPAGRSSGSLVNAPREFALKPHDGEETADEAPKDNTQIAAVILLFIFLFYRVQLDQRQRQNSKLT